MEANVQAVMKESTKMRQVPVLARTVSLENMLLQNQQVHVKNAMLASMVNEMAVMLNLTA
jgi:hypothetical protein